MRLILAFLCATVAWAQYPVNGGLGGGGGGFTAPSGYSATVTGLTTLTVTAAQHGQGPAPTAWCFDNAAPALAVSCSYTVSSIGDVVFTWSPAFTGYVLIRGPGASAGAAGDVVGPAGATAGALACYSGTSGKIIAGCTPLSTVGAVPYVVSAGVLGKDALWNWDSTNKRSVSGNAATGNSTSYNTYAVWGHSSLMTAGGIALVAGSAGDVYLNSGPSAALSFRQNATEVARLAATTGNFLLGGGTTDGGFKGDINRSGSTGTLRVYDQTAATGFTRVLFSLGAADSATTVTFTNAGTTKSAGYQSSDGSAGVTGATCSSFKNGLCVAP